MRSTILGLIMRYIRPGNSCGEGQRRPSKTATTTNLRLVTAELTVRISQSLQANGELDIAATDDVLDLELRELCVEAGLRVEFERGLVEKKRLTLAIFIWKANSSK